MIAGRSFRSWAIRGAGMLAVAVFLVLVARYYHPVYRFTALIQLDAANDRHKISAFHELPIYVHRDTGGYDGLYYAQIAYHPLLDTPELHRAIDNRSDAFAYRARRMLPATLAWLLAGGHADRIVHVYSVLNIVAWFVLAVLLWRMLPVRDARGYLAWAGVMFSAGALASVRLALTDLIAVLFIALGFAAIERGRIRLGTIGLAAAGLSRETSVLALAGLVERPWFSWRNVARGLGALGPLALWLVVVRIQVGSVNPGWGNLTLPVFGFVEKWAEALYAIAWVPDWPLVWTTILAVTGLTTQGLFFLTRWRLEDRWWRLGAAYTVLMLSLGTAVWEGFPGAAMRVLLPLTLAFNVMAYRARVALAWLALGNLTVFAGFIALRDPPPHARELVNTNAGNHATIVSMGSGWYGREQDKRHRWHWARQRAIVRLESWPRTPATVQLEFRLRSLSPRTVIVRQGDRELGRMEIGTSFSDHRIQVPIANGRTEIEFSSDTPAIPEADVPGARELGFGLFDARLAVPEP